MKCRDVFTNKSTPCVDKSRGLYIFSRVQETAVNVIDNLMFFMNFLLRKDKRSAEVTCKLSQFKSRSLEGSKQRQAISNRRSRGWGSYHTEIMTSNNIHRQTDTHTHHCVSFPLRCLLIVFVWKWLIFDRQLWLNRKGWSSR